MRSRLFLPFLIALALSPPLTAAPPAPSWAQAEIVLATSNGYLGGSVKGFRPDAPLTQGELADLVGALTRQPAARVANAAAPVSLAVFNAHVVRALGLSDAASRFAAAARGAGLAPPSRFGTEVVARLLGLRTNHPAAQDALELLPLDPITRAEAAFSVARILRLSPAQLDAVDASASEFTLPALTEPQRLVLRTAVAFIGYPYVWGGEFERRDSPYGLQAQGGFDCSGLAWRVMKLQPYPMLPLLGATLRGRTTMAMSGEVATSKRIPAAKVAPADLVFFGERGPKSKPAEVGHMGISLGNGWFINSSSFGVALAPLSGRYATRLAWARRPLAEAGVA
jgi:cell wall-associated NlpC family hydrolase